MIVDTPLFASFVSGLLGFSMFIVSLFLILLILVQRGRGGGLTGALGGPGGQSAFGTKAGDLFTRITSFVALGWITLCAFTMWLLGPDTAIQADVTRPQISASPTAAPPSTGDLIDLGGTPTVPAGEDRPNVELTPATGEPPATPAETPATPAETPATPAESPAAETSPGEATETTESAAPSE